MNNFKSEKKIHQNLETMVVPGEWKYMIFKFCFFIKGPSSLIINIISFINTKIHFLLKTVKFYLILFVWDIGKSVVHQWKLKVKTETFARRGTVVVNCMYLLGWAMVPRYSVAHCSRCVYEGLFWMRLIFKSVNF